MSPNDINGDQNQDTTAATPEAQPVVENTPTPPTESDAVTESTADSNPTTQPEAVAAPLEQAGDAAGPEATETEPQPVAAPLPSSFDFREAENVDLGPVNASIEALVAGALGSPAITVIGVGDLNATFKLPDGAVCQYNAETDTNIVFVRPAPPPPWETLTERQQIAILKRQNEQLVQNQTMMSQTLTQVVNWINTLPQNRMGLVQIMANGMQYLKEYQDELAAQGSMTYNFTFHDAPTSANTIRLELVEPPKDSGLPSPYGRIYTQEVSPGDGGNRWTEATSRNPNYAQLRDLTVAAAVEAGYTTGQVVYVDATVSPAAPAPEAATTPAPSSDEDQGLPVAANDDAETVAAALTGDDTQTAAANDAPQGDATPVATETAPASDVDTQTAPANDTPDAPPTVEVAAAPATPTSSDAPPVSVTPSTDAGSSPAPVDDSLLSTTQPDTAAVAETQPVTPEAAPVDAPAPAVVTPDVNTVVADAPTPVMAEAASITPVAAPVVDANAPADLAPAADVNSTPAQ